LGRDGEALAKEEGSKKAGLEGGRENASKEELVFFLL
jgi:hypothetical protein